MTHGCGGSVLWARALVLCAIIATVQGHAAVGRTAGNFNVSNTGAATYSIPIFTPPGPHGVQPSIALVYNSNAGVGYLGRGWSLSGLSSIKRCSDTLAQDAQASAPFVNNYDAYCLNGNRLRPQSGSYGLSGSVYATQIADFSRITAVGTDTYASVTYGPSSWTVERKDGLTYTYGSTTDSKAGIWPATLEWMLNQISDRAGNKVKFTWANYSNGVAHPLKIEWTQTSAGSGSYVYSMDFSYGSNTLASSIYGYTGGYAYQDSGLLTGITVSVSGTIKHNYVLTYDTSTATGAKRLTQVKECSDSGATDCLAPTNITYQSVTAGVNTGSPALAVSGNITYATGHYDFNGDGIKDMAYQLAGIWYVRMGSPSSGYGSPINTGLYWFHAGKLLGNNRDQLIGDSGGTWFVYDWNGSSFSATSTGISSSVSMFGQALVADVDGDGRDDLIYITSYGQYQIVPVYQWGNLQISVQRNTSSGGVLSFGAAVSSVVPTHDSPTYPALYAGMGGDWFASYIINADIVEGGDVDGNGRQVLGAKLNIGWCYYPAGSPFWWAAPDYCDSFEENRVLRFDPSSLYLSYGFSSLVYNSGLVATNALPLPTDFNGDGCDDYLLPDPINGNGLGLSDCNQKIGTIYAGATYGSFVAMLDWNGDGRKDYLFNAGATYYARPFYNTSLGSAVNTGISTSCDPFAAELRTDGDGDGLDDMACLVPGSSLTVYNHNNANTIPDLVSQFQDGFGVTYSPTYASIAHSNYTHYTSAVYPYRDVADNHRVVTSFTASDGVGGTYITSYNYFGATQNLLGYGFAGFDKIESTDSRNSIVHVQRFEHEFPNTGMLIEDSLYQPGGVHPIRSRTVAPASLYAATLDATTHNERYFPYPASITEDTYEVGGTKNYDQITHTVTSNTFDSWGNLTASTSTTTDEDTSSPLYTYSWVKAASSTFFPDTTHWCLGLPTAASVTSSTNTGETTVTQSKSFTRDTTNCRMTADSVGYSNLQVDTAYGYDGFGNMNSVSVTGRNPNGTSMSARTTTTGWGTTGQFPVSETNALSQTTTRTFDSTFGSLLAETDPNGIVVASNEYDAFGRPTRHVRADGTATRTTYVLCGTLGFGCQNDPGSGVATRNKLILVNSERDSSDVQFTEELTYTDQFDRPIGSLSRTMSGGYSATVRWYDALGRVDEDLAPCDAYSCAFYWTTNTYDLLGRITSQTHPLSDSNSTPVITTFGYAGRTQTTADANGKNSTKTTDVNGWMRRTIDHDSYLESLGYDAAGNLTSVSHINPHTSTWENLFVAYYVYGAKAFRYSTGDADLGYWNYSYNSLGELVSWSDAKGQTFSQTYDPLSRVTSRTEAEGTTNWTWGTTPGNHEVGRLASVSMTNYGEALSYDSVGRPSTRSITADGGTYPVDYAYTNQGLLDTLTYPTSTSSTRVKVKYGYAYGILQSVTDWTSGAAGTVYWTANAQNPRGQTTQETLGNGVVTNRDFDAVTGWLNTIQSGVGGGMGLQNQAYAYDAVGFVTQRQENTIGLTEDFVPDNLYRMTSSHVHSKSTVTYTYDAMGNITSRSDVNGGATWTYDATKKHAVTSTGTGGVTYSYDANGNMTNRAGYTIGWTSYNYPSTLASAGESTTFYYGPDRQYYRQDYTGPSSYETTYYIGGLLEKVCSSASCASGTIDWRHNIVINGQTVALVSRKSSGTNAVNYPLEDHQGSGSVLTNSSGTNLVRESFDAFGLPRDGSDWDGAVPSGDLTTSEGISRRGYTGHSMLGLMGLIHMNGRVQDAITGRFLSPDPTVPHRDFTQSYNRYAYVNNNPLSFVDLSGFADQSLTAEQCLHAGSGNNTMFDCWQLFGSINDYCGVMIGGCISQVAELIDQGWSLGDITGAMYRIRSESDFQNTVATADANYQARNLRGVVTAGTPQVIDSGGAASSPQGKTSAGTPVIPNPNGTVPGGPWEPAGQGQRPGTFYGPQPPSGGRPMTTWVPPDGEGGPPGSQGYWKFKDPIGTDWQRINPQGGPLTPEQAHPGSRPTPEPSPIWEWAIRPFATAFMLFYSEPAY